MSQRAIGTVTIRILRMIRILGSRPGRTVLQLADLLEVDRRSIYRYLRILEELDYCIEKDVYGRYFMFSSSEISSFLDEEESHFVRTLLESATPHHPLTSGILEKLPTPEKEIIYPVIDIRMGKSAGIINQAILERKRILLVEYHSVSGGTISDRVVEPLEFSGKSGHLMAYDLNAKRVKQFKIDRLKDVELLEESHVYKKKPQIPDLFNMTGSKRMEVALLLTNRGYRLLIEDFPEAKPFTKRSNDVEFIYELNTTVNAYEGIGRFVLGLPGEIKIISPEGFKEYIRLKAGKGWDGKLCT